MTKKINPIMILVILVAAFFVLQYTGFLGAAGPRGSTVTRSITPTSPEPGDTITVSLQVNPGSGVKAILIHEEAPFNINGAASNIYETALISLTALSPETRTYTMTAGSVGTYSFNGEWSEEGIPSGAIDGVSSFTVALCTPSCTRPADLCVEASTVSDGCGGDCSGSWAVQQNTAADSNCDNSVNWTEINIAISNWLSGSYTWTQVNSMVAAWLGG